MLRRVRPISVLLVTVLAGGIFLAGFGAGHRDATARSADDQGFGLLREVLNLARREHLNPAPETSKLFDGAARGMLEALGDPYTRYMEPGVYKEFSQGVKGFFFGIGIFIDMRDGQLIVVQPIEGTPAHRAGLRSGDRIRLINNVPTDGMALQEAVTRIRGPAGTKVKLRIARPGLNVDVEITRARIQVVSVQGVSSLDEATRRTLAADRLGYIRIQAFNDDTPREVAAELDRISKDRARGVIVDLRNNGGGLLHEALEIASRFVPHGRPVLHRVGRDGRRTTERSGGGVKVGLPIVVLVNEFSASASEILAGALHDSADATVVGIKSFGKGVIQSIFPLSSGGAAAVTTEKYLTPADRDIHGVGITPDVVVGERLEGKAEADVTRIQAEQLKRAIDVLRQRLGQKR
ncbi:MAG TPA: S41 family peptidase [bacterium]|nr:S41 family peptidase [bacterium]